MSTLVLQNKSPFECLFRRTSDYNFLHTFGCLCFLFLHPYHAHKLDFRSSPCVLLGYSTLVLPSTAPQQTPHLPIDSASTSPPSSLVILSPAACFSNDHYAGTRSPSLDALAFRSDIVEQPSFVAPSSVSTA